MSDYELWNAVDMLFFFLLRMRISCVRKCTKLACTCPPDWQLYISPERSVGIFEWYHELSAGTSRPLITPISASGTLAEKKLFLGAGKMPASQRFYYSLFSIPLSSDTLKGRTIIICIKWEIFQHLNVREKQFGNINLINYASCYNAPRQIATLIPGVRFHF